jgi:hypothetical protein
LIDHFDNLRQGFVVGIVQLLEQLLAEIVVPKSDLQMDLCLSGLCFCVIQFRNEGSFVSPLSPWFGQIRAY